MIRRALAALLLPWMLAACAATSGGSPVPDAPVRNTLWVLHSLAGSPAAAPGEQQRQAQFTLHLDDNRSTGSGGCNRFTGTYTLKGSSLRFAPQAATRMACTQGMDQEVAFFKVLEQTRRWRIQGDHLWLLDEAGKSLAEFNALYLR